MRFNFSLAQRAVETLNVAGLATLLCHHLMPLCRQYTAVSFPFIGVEGI